MLASGKYQHIPSNPQSTVVSILNIVGHRRRTRRSNYNIIIRHIIISLQYGRRLSLSWLIICLRGRTLPNVVLLCRQQHLSCQRRIQHKSDRWAINPFWLPNSSAHIECTVKLAWPSSSLVPLEPSEAVLVQIDVHGRSSSNSREEEEETNKSQTLGSWAGDIRRGDGGRKWQLDPH